MEYAYATLLLNESNEEINQKNLTAVLEASGNTVETSRVKALVAALEGVDLDDVADDIDDEGVDPADLTDTHDDREVPESDEAGVGTPADETTGASESEPDDGATTER